jgi:hypothetical protein
LLTFHLFIYSNAILQVRKTSEDPAGSSPKHPHADENDENDVEITKDGEDKDDEGSNLGSNTGSSGKGKRKAA